MSEEATEKQFEEYLDSLSPMLVTYMDMTVQYETTTVGKLMGYDFTYYPWAHQRNFAFRTTIDGRLVEKEDGKIYLQFDDSDMRDDILADSEDGKVILMRCQF